MFRSATYCTSASAASRVTRLGVILRSSARSSASRPAASSCWKINLHRTRPGLSEGRPCKSAWYEWKAAQLRLLLYCIIYLGHMSDTEVHVVSVSPFQRNKTYLKG